MARQSNWPKGRHSPRSQRKGQDFPEPVRRRILKHHPQCWFAYPGICTGRSTEAHHVVEVEDGGTNEEDNGVGVCHQCHEHYSAQRSQQRAVQAAWDWKRKPEKHPGVLD